jgi:hypothetical protein
MVAAPVHAPSRDPSPPERSLVRDGQTPTLLFSLSVGLDFVFIAVLAGGTARIIMQGHRGTLFRVVFRYLAIAALSFFGLLD